MKFAKINCLTNELPDKLVTNEHLATLFPEWPAEKIKKKLGIECRHIVEENETALDLAERACKKLFKKIPAMHIELDALIFCTQSPDFALPPNSCLLHARLELPPETLTFDYNHGCSGYVYGLCLAKSLIESGQVSNVLLVNAETYSRYISNRDKNALTLFGDAATATFLTAEENTQPYLSNFIFKTDGTGAKNLVVPQSGQRRHSLPEEFIRDPLKDGTRNLDQLYMNGGEIFSFAVEEVPKLCKRVLEKANLTLDKIDAIIFHQANLYMLEYLRNECGFEKEKCITYIQDVGNTVSCSIPLALENALQNGRVHAGQTVLLVGFGVGYSVAGCLLRI